ncbi:hypothetical protein TVAG_226540 [Trichomonas vaginalis G3]|uniref:alpha-1,2-Mannosidase n=1 Tax=Trichomonas vaginalis (strain ATCC PRA-98 / G3) TaxID=412133 RepID=A2ER88_TRIV3|nr:mannosyl-oligosaccharide 1,2-alpha-mannosidase protein [Trichomonas vaginalis G3]EAY04841.1 hypothetical protein TVAG_226540 [Trichomonas vaginalis G3]KAI5535363.1 mannosyl-oligosaccharide 1,2-alpha-mannosidase protein [Trichomonas vaginalis G3]|eukprot:XP_001317064.1 hypothetical protein [Trichomonas vaginalis G3]
MEIKSFKFILSIWAFIIFATVSALLVRPINQAISRFDRKDQYIESILDEMSEVSPEIRMNGFYGDIDYKKLRKIRKGFLYLWNNYRFKAWSHDVINDEYEWEDYIHLALSMLASHGTLSLMGLKMDVYEIDKFFNKTKLQPKGSIKLSVFFGQVIEGLISAYENYHSGKYFNKIQELLQLVNMSVYEGSDMITISKDKIINSGNSLFNLHEFSTVILALLQSYHHMQSKTYYSYSLKAFEKILSNKAESLPKNIFNNKNLHEASRSSSFDSNGYSFYDNLVKINILTNNSIKSPENDVNEIFDAIYNEYIEIRGDSAYIVQKNGKSDEKIVTLDSFLFGGLILLRRNIPPDSIQKFGEISKKLSNGLFNFLNLSVNGFPPKSAVLKGKLEVIDSSYDLSHRVLETLLIYYRSTHRKEYRDAAWKIFKAVNESCKTIYGYSPVIINGTNVTQVHKEVDPKIYSGFFKLMYLIFLDSSVVDLDHFVITSDGNILKIWSESEPSIDSEVFESASRINVL